MGLTSAARVLVDVSDVAQFPVEAHFAAWNGTAPLGASSGRQIHHHRPSRAGNWQISHVLCIMVIVQLRHDTAGRAYHRRLLARGKTPMEALRVLNAGSPTWSTGSCTPTTCACSLRTGSRPGRSERTDLSVNGVHPERPVTPSSPPNEQRAVFEGAGGLSRMEFG